LDLQGNLVASAPLRMTAVNTGTGTFWHQMYNTYYYLARESDYSGADNTTLYDSSCTPLATVPAAFSDDVCIQGSGKLDNGTLVHYAGTCNCGRPCPTGGTVCYHTLNPAQYPWGMGSANNPIEPFRSWAVDNTLISRGTVLYSPDWDGVWIPASGDGDGLGGFTHDGCFRADDVGGWIQDYHYDFNCGTRTMWHLMEAITPTYTYVDVHMGADKCAYLIN
ncbi:MAG: hypothetical protein CSA75_04235, partial [Sorangium cellulosum]